MAIEYKLNLARIKQELKEGDFVLVGLDGFRWVGKQYVRRTAVGRVITGGTETSEIEVPDLGIVKGEKPRYGATGLDVRHPNRELIVYAASKLRTDDQDITFEYLDRLSGVYPFNSVALHVTTITEAGITGRLIGENGRSEGNEPGQLNVVPPEQNSLAISQVGSADVSDVFPVIFHGFNETVGSPKPIPDVKVGDVLIARDFRFEFVNGKPRASLIDIAVIGNFAETDDAVSFLGLKALPPTPDHAFVPTLASASQISYEYDAAHARTEPDSALVLFYNDPSSPNRKNVNAHVLGSSGYYAFITDDIVDYFDGMAVEPGLWMVENVSIHGWQASDGEWDAELNGDFNAATTADVERLFGAPIDAELASILEIEEEPGLGEKYMQMARTALFEEKFDQEHMIFARHRMGLLGERKFHVEDVLNLDQLDSFLSERMASIEPDVLRDQMIASMKVNVLERGHLFHPVVPTEEEAEEFNSRKTWRKTEDRIPAIFVADAALYRDIATVVHAVGANVHHLMKQIDGGANFSRSTLKHLMRKIVPTTVPEGLRSFSMAKHTEGEWLFVEKNEREVTLALFAKGEHVVTLIASGEKARLISTCGLEVTSPDISINSGRYIPVNDVLRDADRAIAEIEARREVYGDYFRLPEDGVYEVHSKTIHIEDGVIHRENGPAVIRVPRFDGDSSYEEYRFRGNIHRDREPAIVEGKQFVWYRHGLEHNIDGPSSILGGNREYRQFDRLHKERGPAVESDVVLGWYRNGIPDRDDGLPTLIYKGMWQHHRAGLLHRSGEPAVEHNDGTLGYYFNGRLHNLEGPASISEDGTIYAIDGEEMPYEEFTTRMAIKNPAPTI
jgi:hypothetical protein